MLNLSDDAPTTTVRGPSNALRRSASGTFPYGAAGGVVQRVAGAGEAGGCAVLARKAEALVDAMVAAVALAESPPGGSRIAIVAGPGGPAVGASDARERAGLTLAEFSARAAAALGEAATAAGTGTRNPVDVGMVLAYGSEIYGTCLRHALADPKSSMRQRSLAGSAETLNGSRAC